MKMKGFGKVDFSSVEPEMYTVKFITSAMKKWLSSQTNNRWAKYYDEVQALPAKTLHQEKYLEEVASVLNAHNKYADPEDMWHLHGWYNRWIFCADGRYFIIVCVLRNGLDGPCRTFLGNTLISIERYRKDTVLQLVQKFCNETLADSYVLNTEDFGRNIMHCFEEKILRHIIAKCELLGLDIFSLVLLIKKLVEWMNLMDCNKNLKCYLSGCENWMQYFLEKVDDTLEFCENYILYAPDKFYGMFRTPLCPRTP